MSEPIPLPQFAPGVGCNGVAWPNLACKPCRSPLHGDWREQHAGVREFSCPHGVGTSTQRAPVPLEVVQDRIASDCKLRQADGTCSICGCKSKNKACAVVAATHDCAWGR